MSEMVLANIELDGGSLIARCPEISGANGQGRMCEECLDSLRYAINLILEDDLHSESNQNGDSL